MQKISRFVLFGALILILLTTACGAEEGTTPTLSGTTFPGLEDTPTLGAPNTTQTAETETATTAETATERPETPTVSVTEPASTQAAASPCLSCQIRQLLKLLPPLIPQPPPQRRSPPIVPRSK